jgi:site-specific recombinase XerD
MQGKGSNLDAAIRTFVLDRQIGGCSRATLEAYTFQLEPFVKWARMRSLDLDDLTEEHLREFLLQRGEVGHATLYSATARLKTFFKWCGAEGLCRDLAAALRKPRQAQAVVSTLTVKELQALLSCCRGNGFVGRRDEALVRFLVDTAARISEALDLTIDRLEVDSGRALLNGKGGRERFVFFGSKTAKALIRYLAGCESRGFHLLRSVFVNAMGRPSPVVTGTR